MRERQKGELGMISFDLRHLLLLRPAWINNEGYFSFLSIMGGAASKRRRQQFAKPYKIVHDHGTQTEDFTPVPLPRVNAHRSNLSRASSLTSIIHHETRSTTTEIRETFLPAGMTLRSN